jgi:hypothetical protein
MTSGMTRSSRPENRSPCQDTRDRETMEPAGSLPFAAETTAAGGRARASTAARPRAASGAGPPAGEGTTQASTHAPAQPGALIH